MSQPTIQDLEDLRRLAELERKRSGSTLGEKARDAANEAGNAVAGGSAKALYGLLGLPADLVNLVTQTSPKIMNALGVNASPILKLYGGSQDVRRLVETVAGEPTPEAKTVPGKLLEGAVTGGIGGAVSGAPVLGALGGLLGEGTMQATDSPTAAAVASTLPFLTKAGWQAFRPMRAEHTAKDLLRNVNSTEMDEAYKKIAEAKARGVNMLPGQALPPHSQTAGLSQSLAATTDGKPIVDALVQQTRRSIPNKPTSPVELMQKGFQSEANTLYAQGDRVFPTRQAVNQLKGELFKLPRQLAVTPGSDQAQKVRRGLEEALGVLNKRPSARQLSTWSDQLAARPEVIPGAGPFFPKAAEAVRQTAVRTQPAIGQADQLVGRGKELGEALGRVRIPLQSGMADIDPGAFAPNAFLAVGGQLTGHPLISGAAIARIARSVIAGAPEAKLAEALADPTMKKLLALAGATRPKNVSAHALRAAIQAQLAGQSAPME